MIYLYMKNSVFLIFFLLYFVPIKAQVTTQYQDVKILGSIQGLSSSKINSLVEDVNGFVWIGTEDGLNKYDGNRFTVYRRIENDLTSLHNNYITCLFYDSQNQLWVGHSSGLQCYNEEKGVFTYPPKIILEQTRTNHPILWITEDSKNNLWISIQGKGVLKYSLLTGHTQLFKASTGNGGLHSKAVRHITEDENGNIWLASFDAGIAVYNTQNNSFSYLNEKNGKLATNAVVRMQSMKNGKMLISTLGDGLYVFDANMRQPGILVANTTAFAIQPLADRSLFVGTDGLGVLVFDQSGKKLISHPAESLQSKNIIGSKIHALLEDHNGNLWLGMYNEGIAFVKKEPLGFFSYKRGDKIHKTLNYGQVSGITTDKQGNVWFSTDGGGLNFYDKSTSTYSYYKHQPTSKSSIADNAVVCVYCDKQGIIWAGTYTGGLCKFDPISKKFTSYQNSSSKNSIPCNYVKNIIEDEKGNLWIGTDGGGFSYFDKTKETFENFSVKEYKELNFDYITCLYIQKDTLWIGSHGGVARMDVNTKEIVRCSNRQFAVYSIAADKKGNIWVGSNLGLYKYNKDNNSFLKQNLSVQFANVVINGIIPHKEYLWMSTSQGIVCYLPDKEEIVFYVSNNDLGNTSFIRSSYHISANSELFFGGSDGCYSFFPDSLNIKSNSPKVFFTGFEVYNQTILPGKPYNGKIILDKSLQHTDKIFLRYNENTLNIKFSAPLTDIPSSLSYMCFMEGVDKQWIPYLSDQRSVTYANLSPGNYVFKVYATNVPSQNVRAKDITTLYITVYPPMWLTWWAKLLYILATLSFIYSIFWFFYQRMKDRNQLALEKLKSKHLEELDRNKMQFFTNISHEFRTPLTLIISPLEELKKEMKDIRHIRILDTIMRNANRLLNLINQILDLRKAENNKLEIKAQQINISLFIKEIVNLFSVSLQLKKINIEIDQDSDDIEIWYDPDLLGKVLVNLLSNALKYTPENGNIKIKTDNSSDSYVTIEVVDNGYGIASSELPHLFERFYQDTLSRISGTGIGLHFVKTITTLHKGDIDVKSELGEGSCFTLYIRKGKDHFDLSEYENTMWTPVAKNIQVDCNFINEENTTTDSANLLEKTILLVEDEPDMRLYIHNRLSTYYNIIEAANGKEALGILKQQHPDLVITDVMMPEMDGIEFTRIIKENFDSCDIPVILLTANNETEQKLAGLETGADSYIVKPFNMEYLKARIKKLLETRRKILEKYQTLLNLEPQQIAVDNPDEVLLQNSINYIRNNISEPELSVEEISKYLNVSRTNLHRKIKKLTGNSPVELIKIIRMKQAAQLLDSGNMTVSEVAYEVGYNALSYFSSSFSAYWGTSPTAYLKNKHPHKI